MNRKQSASPVSHLNNKEDIKQFKPENKQLAGECINFSNSKSFWTRNLAGWPGGVSRILKVWYT